jgi:hypothetical protein
VELTSRAPQKLCVLAQKKGELFDVRTASFAHAGQDFGQLSGVPEPAGVSLIALIVVCAAVLLRRKITHAV